MNRIEIIDCQNVLELKKEAEKSRHAALGLDLGLHCGFAYSLYHPEKRIWYLFPGSIGIINLSPTKYESGSSCFIRLLDFLDEINPKIIFYELIRFTPHIKGGTAKILRRVAQPIELLSSLRQTALIWSEENKIPFIGIPIQTIKKVATGRGNANKKDIIEACNEQFKTSLDPNKKYADNAADAAFVLYAGLSSYSSSACKWGLEPFVEN